MITTDIDFPTGLPCALREGYGLQHVQPFIRTQMASGRARQRRTFTSVPTMAQVAWVMSELQARVFEAWFQEVISDGAAWFNCTLKTPMGLHPYVCRFTEMYKGPELIGANSWRISAELEIFERPIMPPGWGSFPDLILGSRLIDLALNKHWPRRLTGGNTDEDFIAAVDQLHELIHTTLPTDNYW